MKKLTDKLKNNKFIETLKKNNKYKPILYSLLILLFIGIIGTISFYSNSAEFNNKFKTSAYDIEIEEEFYNEWGVKKVSFINNDSTDVFIRVNFNELWLDFEGNILNNKLNNKDIVNKVWTTSWKYDFEKGSDGWYYYKKIFKNGDKVQVLKQIYVNQQVLVEGTDEYDKYALSTYKLDFNYEAIQADSKAVKEVWGITPEIGETIKWF